ncbi:uncharacterized protein LOC144637192 [Oculina patagonica]
MVEENYDISSRTRRYAVVTNCGQRHDPEQQSAAKTDHLTNLVKYSADLITAPPSTFEELQILTTLKPSMDKDLDDLIKVPSSVADQASPKSDEELSDAIAEILQSQVCLLQELASSPKDSKPLARRSPSVRSPTTETNSEQVVSHIQTPTDGARESSDSLQNSSNSSLRNSVPELEIVGSKCNIILTPSSSKEEVKKSSIKGRSQLGKSPTASRSPATVQQKQRTETFRKTKSSRLVQEQPSKEKELKRGRSDSSVVEKALNHSSSNYKQSSNTAATQKKKREQSSSGPSTNRSSSNLKRPQVPTALRVQNKTADKRLRTNTRSVAAAEKDNISSSSETRLYTTSGRKTSNMASVTLKDPKRSLKKLSSSPRLANARTTSDLTSNNSHTHSDGRAKSGTLKSLRSRSGSDKAPDQISDGEAKSGSSRSAASRSGCKGALPDQISDGRAKSGLSRSAASRSASDMALTDQISEVGDGRAKTGSSRSAASRSGSNVALPVQLSDGRAKSGSSRSAASRSGSNVALPYQISDGRAKSGLSRSAASRSASDMALTDQISDGRVFSKSGSSRSAASRSGSNMALPDQISDGRAKSGSCRSATSRSGSDMALPDQISDGTAKSCSSRSAASRSGSDVPLPDQISDGRAKSGSSRSAKTRSCCGLTTPDQISDGTAESGSPLSAKSRSDSDVALREQLSYGRAKPKSPKLAISRPGSDALVGSYRNNSSTPQSDTEICLSYLLGGL